MPPMTTAPPLLEALLLPAVEATTLRATRAIALRCCRGQADASCLPPPSAVSTSQCQRHPAQGPPPSLPGRRSPLAVSNDVHVLRSLAGVQVGSACGHAHHCTLV